MHSSILDAIPERRISTEDAFRILEKASLLELASKADEYRYVLNPDPFVTYILDRNINYTNICMSGCLFCAYHVAPGDERGFVLSADELELKINETIKAGGRQILLQGGLNPTLSIEYYESLFKNIKNKFDIHLHALSPPEIIHISNISALSVKDTLNRLIDAGLDSIPGGGAEILSDKVRNKLSPDKCTTGQWLEVMRTAHELGLKTTATMMFGHIESLRDRIEHLENIRRLQDETGGFTAFIPWAYQPANTALGGDKTSALDYLKTLALSRLFLDNIKHIQVSWVTQGAKIAQVALSYGADDFGSLMMEENVVKAAGVNFRMNEAEIVRCIEDMGLKAKRRDMYYNIIGDPLCQTQSQ